MPNKQPIAEVLTSSITGLTAETLPPSAQVLEGQKPEVQKPDLQKPDGQKPRPKFGSFVKIESPENEIDIFAVVFDVVTNPPDSVHKPSALGMSRDKLRLEQPHIFALLKTHIQAAVIGYRQGKSFFQHLPPQPAEVHDFVYEAQADEVNMLTADFEFLRLLAHINSVPTDELIAAAIRQAAAARNSNNGRSAGKVQVISAAEYLVEAGRAISQLFRSDYDRMVSIVRKIKPSPD